MREETKKVTKKVFWLDIPRSPDRIGYEGEWEAVATFKTKKEAEKFLMDTWGIEKKWGELFIMEGEI